MQMHSFYPTERDSSKAAPETGLCPPGFTGTSHGFAYSWEIHLNVTMFGTVGSSALQGVFKQRADISR